MPLRRTKLYPTPANCQHANELVWPVNTLLVYFQQLLNSIPEEERAGATVEFESAVPSIYWLHNLNQYEIDQERMLLLFNDLSRRANAGQGMTGEEVKELVQRFQALG
jgi:hypothetical protein